MQFFFGLILAVALFVGVGFLVHHFVARHTWVKEKGEERTRVYFSNVRLYVGVIALVIALVTPLFFYLSGQEEVKATEEAVIVDAPIFFGKDGVQTDARYTGRHFVWFTSEMYRYANTPITFEEEFTDLPSSDNVQMDFRIYAVIQLIRGQAPEVHRTVGFHWYENRIMKVYRTIIRDKMTQLTADEMRLDATKLRQVELDIQSGLDELFKTAGIQYTVISISVGGVTPPDEVLKESERTAAQTQRKKTEHERMLAEEKRETAETKRALADKAYMNNLGVSTELFVQLEGYNAYKVAAERCASSQHCTMVVGQPGTDIAVPVGK